MEVREAMTPIVLTIGPDVTLRRAATLMTERHVGAAVVFDPDAPGQGIISERDIVNSIARGEDPDSERVGEHLSDGRSFFASPEWSLEEAAMKMISGRFRHLLVVDGGELSGVISSRDILKIWTGEGASCRLTYA